MHLTHGFLFPGQGSQFVGMGADLAARFDAARRVFSETDEVMGIHLSRIMMEGPEQTLRETRFTQPALLAHSLALLAVLRDLVGEIWPSVVAGHSLGEYGALVAAGVLTPLDALRVVKRRGELMQQAGQLNPGAMAAVIGIDEQQVADVLARAAEAGVVVAANINAPDQTVISGSREAVQKAMELAAGCGAKRVIPLAVSGAFHSPLMAGVAQDLARIVHSVTFSPPACPVVPNVTATPTADVDELRRCVLLQIERPVRWTDSMRVMIAAGTTSFLEMGPGRVLAGLGKRIDRTISVESLSDPVGLTVFAERIAPHHRGAQGSMGKE